MVSNPIDTEVLIVGAGPVGLFLANECARRNLRWRLIEERSSQSEHSKALAIFPRTLEIFDMAGIVAPFLEQANRVTKVAVMIRDRTLAHMKFEPPESPYSFVAMVPQDVTERAGDAAHIHSPFGGQGMNTGLHDIWNLVWKLDLFLKGRGSQELLDSYSSERLPVIKNVIETTDLLTKIMGTPHRFAQALRDTVIPIVSRLAPFQHAFVQRLSELGIAYQGSPIVEGPGKRYFDDSLREGKGISSRFLLFLGNEAEASTKEAAKQLAASFSGVVELRSLDNQDLLLVRPDGYVAYSSHNSDTAAFEAMRSVLQRQIVSAAPEKRVA